MKCSTILFILISNVFRIMQIFVIDIQNIIVKLQYIFFSNKTRMVNSFVMERNHTIMCQQLKHCSYHVPCKYFAHWVKFRKGRFHITGSSIEKKKIVPSVCITNENNAREINYFDRHKFGINIQGYTNS